jgi:hypothetical protein
LRDRRTFRHREREDGGSRKRGVLRRRRWSAAPWHQALGMSAERQSASALRAIFDYQGMLAPEQAEQAIDKLRVH